MANLPVCLHYFPYTSGTVLATSSSSIDVTSGTDTTTAYRYHRIVLNGNASNIVAVAEVQFFGPGSVSNMRLETVAQTADSSVASGRVTMEINPVDAITLGTDLTSDITCKLDTATVTISNGSPGVITHTAHGLSVNDPVTFTTSGALPTGLTAGTTYFVKTVSDANTYMVSSTPGGSVINTSAGSGTHTATYHRWAPASLSNVGLGQSGRTVVESDDTARVAAEQSFAFRINVLNSKIM